MRHPFSSFARVQPGSTGPAPEALRSIWLARGRNQEADQRQLPGLDGETILLGGGALDDISMGKKISPGGRVELLLTIRFQHCFDARPHVVVLPNDQHGPEAKPLRLEARNVGRDGFILVLHLPPDTACRRVGFRWLAIGSQPDRQAPIPPNLVPEDQTLMSDPSSLPPTIPPTSPRVWWLRGVVACAALLPVASLRRLRHGARRRLAADPASRKLPLYTSDAQR